MELPGKAFSEAFLGRLISLSRNRGSYTLFLVFNAKTLCAKLYRIMHACAEDQIPRVKFCTGGSPCAAKTTKKTLPRPCLTDSEPQTC